MKFSQHLFIKAQFLIPQHALSQLASKVAYCKNKLIKNLFIRWFIRQYRVDMTEAEICDVDQFQHFNAFFTRKLKSNARAVCQQPATLVSPVDGGIYQVIDINQGQLLQAKKHHYTLEQLLANDQTQCQQFHSGRAITLYLSPKDYHRVHMPVAGRLLSMRYVPGQLFSVNNTSYQAIPGLFARNERLVMEFETAYGPMILIMIGAMIVNGIHTVWHGQVAPASGDVTLWNYQQQSLTFNAGDELGYFSLGSSVMILWPDSTLVWQRSILPDTSVTMGQAIASISCSTENECQHEQGA